MGEPGQNKMGRKGVMASLPALLLHVAAFVSLQSVAHAVEVPHLMPSLMELEEMIGAFNAHSQTAAGRPTALHELPTFGARPQEHADNPPFSRIPIGVRIHFEGLTSGRSLRFAVRQPNTQRAPLNYLFEVDFEGGPVAPARADAAVEGGDGNGGASKLGPEDDAARVWPSSEDGTGRNETAPGARSGRCPGARLELRIHCGEQGRTMWNRLLLKGRPLSSFS